jgi:hypothetical protein
VTRDRKYSVAGAVLIVAAAAALSLVNYVKGTVFWALIGAGAALFVVGVGLYAFALRRQQRQGAPRQVDRRAPRSKGER